jgi:hypothetical protein
MNSLVYPSTDEYFIHSRADGKAFDAAKVLSAAFIKDVQENSTPPGFAQYCSAREVAHDYEQIRIALDYEEINFLALS